MIIVDAYLQKVASIQQYIVSAPFYHFFNALSNDQATTLQPKTLSYFPNEPLYHYWNGMMSRYIVPKASQVCVVFSINEEDDTDRSLMQVFLLELSEAKRVVPGGPSVNYSKEEPAELRSLPAGNREKASVGYLVFCKSKIGLLLLALNKDHVTKDKIVNAAAMMGNFRFYLDYHIKSTKTFLHTRMRNRADKWKNCKQIRFLSSVVMNEAHFEEETVQWKKANGKTFVK